MPNLTIKIDDEELLRRAKVLAAERGTSLSAMVREYLIDLVDRDAEYERARKRAHKTLDQALHLGGRPLAREEIYDGRSG
jgi:plasmid stability protein